MDAESEDRARITHRLKCSEKNKLLKKKQKLAMCLCYLFLLEYSTLPKVIDDLFSLSENMRVSG